MEAGSWQGRWWLPSTPELVVEGTLEVDGSDLSLSTDGMLEAPPEPECDTVYGLLWEPREHAVVHGQLADGRPVTLLGASGMAITAPVSAARENWHPQAALLGAHLADGHDKAFRRVSVRLQHLSAFAGDPHVGGEWSFQQATGDLASVSLSAERRVLHTASVPGGRIELVSRPVHAVRNERHELGVEVSFEAELDTAADWSAAWQAAVLPLRDLLAVLLGRPVAVRHVVLRADAGEPPVRLLLRLPEEHPGPRGGLSSYDFVYTAKDLPGGFDAALNAWWRARDASRVAVREIVDVINAPRSYVDDKLVGCVRAVGPLADADGKAAAAEHAVVEDQAWLDEVRDALPDHLRDAVLGRLGQKGPNERHRLVALIRSLGPAGQWLTGGDPETFAQRVVVTRSAAAHPSSKPPKSVIGGAPLVAHARALGWILRAVLVMRLGVNEEDLHKALSGSAAAQAADAVAQALVELAAGAPAASKA
jgi:hypothetical protein